MTHHLQGNLSLPHPKRLTADFSAEAIEARMQWNNIQSAQRKTCQPRILYLAKLFFQK